MTHSDTSAHVSSGFSIFDRAGPFAALTSLIRQHADNPDVQPSLGAEAAHQIAVTVAEGFAPALVAAMATTTGEILNERVGRDPQRGRQLAAIIAQPGWSPAPEAALNAAHEIVADYSYTPRPPDPDIGEHSSELDEIAQADMLNAGLMMCLELLHAEH